MKFWKNLFKKPSRQIVGPALKLTAPPLVRPDRSSIESFLPKQVFDHDAPFSPSSFADVASILTEMGFTAEQYRARFADMRDHTDETLMLHFLLYGIKEKRIAALNYPRRQMSALLKRLGKLPIADKSLQVMWLDYFLYDFANSVLHSNAVRGDVEKLVFEDYEALFSVIPNGLFPVIVIGDSHSVQFQQFDSFGGRSYFPIRMACIGGSARGLANRDSKLRFGARIQKLLKVAEGLIRQYNLPIIFKFGQVDIEFVYNMRRAALGQATFDDADLWNFAQHSVSRYMDFLEYRLGSLRHNIYVCSINPPALSNGSWADGYLKAHHQVEYAREVEGTDSNVEALKKLEMPSLLERTLIHAEFNATLERESLRRGFKFLNDFSMYLDPKTGVIDPRFLAESNGTDCHIDWRPSSNVMKSFVRSFMTSY